MTRLEDLLVKIDGVLTTHEHHQRVALSHLDGYTGPRFTSLKQCGEHMKRMTELEASEE